MFSIGDNVFSHKNATSKNTAEKTSYLPKIGLSGLINLFSFIFNQFRSFFMIVLILFMLKYKVSNRTNYGLKLLFSALFY